MASASLLPVDARRLDGKVAIITGGASGIGECTARLFARHGAKVVIADVQDDIGRSVCNDISPDVASFVHCDVTNESDVSAAVDFAVHAHGKLDIMFNNAGIPGALHGHILDSEKPDFERVMSVNVTGPFLGTKHAARVMIPKRSGSIIITSSVSSVVAAATYAYTCSKHAVVGLAKTAAMDLGQYGIRVNCVSPFGVATPLLMSCLGTSSTEEAEEQTRGRAVLKGVTLKAEDIANAVLYLATEDSRYVSGQNLLVDGGFSFTKAF